MESGFLKKKNGKKGIKDEEKRFDDGMHHIHTLRGEMLFCAFDFIPRFSLTSR